MVPMVQPALISAAVRLVQWFESQRRARLSSSQLALDQTRSCLAQLLERQSQ